MNFWIDIAINKIFYFRKYTCNKYNIKAQVFVKQAVIAIIK